MVRDIPYYIAVSDKEQGYECVTKPEILDRLLQTIELKSRHIICEFRWEDLRLPKEILKLPHEDPETHEYLEVWIPERKKWVKVDPTWDSRLRPKLPIAEWDGLSNTKLAVIPIKILSPEESAAFIAQDIGEEREKYMERNRKFFIALNRWLESIRKKI
jgi:hypothetical protein